MDKKDFLKLEFLKEGKNVRLQLLFATDERGIVYRVATTLYANNWNILEANIRSFENGQIEDEFLINRDSGNEITEEEKEDFKSDLQKLFREEISITSYLIKKGKVANQSKGNLEARINFEIEDKVGNSKLRIQTKDRSGLLSEITRIFYLECIDILSVQAKTKGNEVDDIFEIKSETGLALDENMKTRLIKNLRKIL